MSDMTQYGTPPVRTPMPMTIGQILDRIRAILRYNVRLFLLMGTVPAGAMLVLYAMILGALFVAGVFPPNFPTRGSPGVEPITASGFWVLGIVWVVGAGGMLVAQGVFQGAACGAAIQVNRGMPATFGSAYGAAWPRTGRYVWLIFLHALIISLPIAVVVLVGFLPFIFAAASSHGNPSPGTVFAAIPLIILGYVGGMVYAVWMMLKLCLAFPACAAEDISAIEALKRSNRLTYKAKGRMFPVFLVVYAITYAVIMVLEFAGFAVFAVGMLIGSALHPGYGVGIALGVAAGVCVALIFLALMALMWASYAITMAVIYDDQRLRIDGMPALPAGEPV